MINSGFHLAKLKKLGYNKTSHYIDGMNKWGKPRRGWAGLTEDGATIGNVSGKITNLTKLKKGGSCVDQGKVFLTLFIYAFEKC